MQQILGNQKQFFHKNQVRHLRIPVGTATCFILSLSRPCRSGQSCPCLGSGPRPRSFRDSTSTCLMSMWGPPRPSGPSSGTSCRPWRRSSLRSWCLTAEGSVWRPLNSGSTFLGRSTWHPTGCRPSLASHSSAVAQPPARVSSWFETSPSNDGQLNRSNRSCHR